MMRRTHSQAPFQGFLQTPDGDAGHGSMIALQSLIALPLRPGPAAIVSRPFRRFVFTFGQGGAPLYVETL